MTREVAPIDDDDGFDGPLNRQPGRNYLRWTAADHWFDRDGLVPPSPLLVIRIDEGIRSWPDNNNNKPEVILDKPLPDLEELNASVPKSQWKDGLDGKPRPPYEHIIIVYLIAVATGEIYKYEATTTGAHIAFDHLKEAVMGMRMLRGERVRPLVHLNEAPMKTHFGTSRRPHFEIIGWKAPGDGGGKVIAQSATPQLSGPDTVTSPAPAASSAAPRVAQPQAKAKPAVKLADETLASMQDVEPVTSEEVLKDKIPW